MPRTPPPTTSGDLVTALTVILADTYALAVKTHGAHWNVTGPGFFALHRAFGEQ
jgi:starvation-inducible DNA-binding protein